MVVPLTDLGKTEKIRGGKRSTFGEKTIVLVMLNFYHSKGCDLMYAWIKGGSATWPCFIQNTKCKGIECFKSVKMASKMSFIDYNFESATC